MLRDVDGDLGVVVMAADLLHVKIGQNPATKYRDIIILNTTCALAIIDNHSLTKCMG